MTYWKSVNFEKWWKAPLNFPQFHYPKIDVKDISPYVSLFQSNIQYVYWVCKSLVVHLQKYDRMSSLILASRLVQPLRMKHDMITYPAFLYQMQAKNKLNKIAASFQTFHNCLTFLGNKRTGRLDQKIFTGQYYFCYFENFNWLSPNKIFLVKISSNLW